MSFFGYPRPDGTVGIRNQVVVLPGGLVSAKICEFVNGVSTLISADVGSGRTKRDRETIARTLVGLGRNPNVAGVILHDIRMGSSYPELGADTLAAQIADTGKPVEVISSPKDQNAFQVLERGIRVAREMVRETSRIRREQVEDGHLAIAIKCGRSDTTSGIAGNPVMGCLADAVVTAGGTVLFGETTEIIGAEHLLAQRAVNQEAAREIIEAALSTEERAKRCGEDIRTINPVPANIAGGLSTLEEKSLGAIAKSGTSPIQGVLRYAEGPRGKGLYFVDNWMTQLSIFLGYAAAGATLTLYQLGGGGFLKDTFLSPSPTGIAPLLWATANRHTMAAAGETIDFYSGTVMDGKETIEQAGERLCALVKEIASGAMTKSETLKYQDPTQVYLLDPPF
jgi:altronate dehydratase large subunit